MMVDYKFSVQGTWSSTSIRPRMRHGLSTSPSLTTFPPPRGGAKNSNANCVTALDSQLEPPRTVSKRNKKHNGGRMEDRLRAKGIQFHPMGFDALGTPGATWSNLLKKLSSTAHVRRKHGPKTCKGPQLINACCSRFARWTSRIAFTLVTRALNKSAAELNGSRASFSKAVLRSLMRACLHCASTLVPMQVVARP